MTPEKILSVIKMYEQRFKKENIPKERMDIKWTFKALSDENLLAHAHFLIDGLKRYAKNPDRQGKLVGT